MSRKILAVAVTFLLLASVAGCMTESGYYSPERSAGAGALGGAATGAWVGAAAGGVLGAVGGYLYAEHRNSEIRSSQMAAQAYNYPGQGNVVAIDRADVSPASARPGQTVNLGITYTILTPGNAPTTVTLVREVRFGGNVLGQPYQEQVTNNNGTFSDSVQYGLPKDAARGNYSVVSRVLAPFGSSEKVAYFTVQ